MDPKPNEGPGPTEEGQRTNKAAGKLAGKKTLITGGDNGIGRAVAMLFAEEGAEVAIAYWPAEEQHAQTTKKHVEKNNGKIFLFEAEFSVPKKCMELVENVVKALGGLNILVNVLGFQVTKDDISDISE
jgi:NAD(P)-dependent dehydrogenase (short-subunit alcohol dehydrogenase family)